MFWYFFTFCAGAVTGAAILIVGCIVIIASKDEAAYGKPSDKEVNERMGLQ